MATPLPLPAYTRSSLHPHEPVSVASLLPSPSSPPPKRADLISIKLRLAALLSPSKGQAYWNALQEFMLGRITREELDEVIENSFGRNRAEAVKLHNALLLSILYNTTRPYLPPSSIRHSGFNPRGGGGSKKRGAWGGGGGAGAGAGEDPDETTNKRIRLVREKVMQLGRRERGELKLLGTGGGLGGGGLEAQSGVNGISGAGKRKAISAGGGGGGAGSAGGKAGMKEEEEERVRIRRMKGRLSEAVGGTSYGGVLGVDGEGVNEGVRGKGALAQEYRRLAAQTQLCCESKVLPDSEGMRDRMLLLAYEAGLTEGVESRVAGLMEGAIEDHLQNMLASVISLVRGTRRAVPTPRASSSNASSLASTPIPTQFSTFAPAGSAPPAPSISISLAAPSTALADDEDEQPIRPLPLTIGDFHALFAISPSLLGQHPHSGAVERMYAIPPPDSSSDEDDSSEDEQHVAQAHGRTAAQNKALKDREDAEGDTEMLDMPPPNAAMGGKPMHPVVSSLAASSPASTTGQGAGKKPRLSRSRQSSFYGGVRPILPALPFPSTSSSSTNSDAANLNPSSASTGSTSTLSTSSGLKNRFVLDPTSLHGVPEGHPDVPPLPSTPAPPPPPILTASSASSLPAAAQASSGSGGGGGGGSNALSPKSLSLRNALFPELVAPSAISSISTPTAPASGAGTGTKGSLGTIPGTAGGDGNGTTDAGESDSEVEGGGGGKPATGAGAGAGGGGLKIKLGASVGPGQGEVGPGAAGQKAGAATGGGGGGGGTKQSTNNANERDRDAGRKLWEVVDSVRLLDGVLEP
ncbi:hypothetical protein JCM11641_008171 [Rhodosporidiobolus odoratus]